MARVAFIMDKLLRKLGAFRKKYCAYAHRLWLYSPWRYGKPYSSLRKGSKDDYSFNSVYELYGKVAYLCLFYSSLFQKYEALVMIGLYVFGIVMGILMALIFKKTAFKGEAVPFVMELPNYRMPGAKNVGHLLWDKAKDFLQRAFTVIFVEPSLSGFCRTLIQGLTWYLTPRTVFWHWQQAFWLLCLRR